MFLLNFFQIELVLMLGKLASHGITLCRSLDFLIVRTSNFVLW